MGKPVPPPWHDPVPPFWLGPGAPPVMPTTTPFGLSPEWCDLIASSLGLKKLPPLTKQTIELVISVYKMQSGLPTVTVGKNLAAIDEALEKLDAAKKALRPFTDVRHSGVGAKTVHALNPSACEVNASIRKFRIEAQARKEELRRCKRFRAEHGPFGELGGYIRFLHDIVRGSSKAGPKRKLLRTFAISVFEAAGIPWKDYFDHPSRMDKLLTPKIPDGPQTQIFTAKIRQEIETARPPSKVTKNIPSVVGGF